MKLNLVLFIGLFSQVCLGQRPLIEVRANGLVPDTTYFQVGERQVNDNVFASGTKVYLNLSGIRGFAIKDGMSFPGCSMKVIGSNNIVLFENPDVFSDKPEGVENKDARSIHLNLTIGSPMVENATYRWESRVWDKLTKAELTVSTTVRVIRATDKLGIKKTSEGLTMENVILLSNEPLSNNRVHVGEKINIVFTGVRGFTLNQEKKATLGASMIVKDANNVNLIEMTDLFKEGGSFDPVMAETLRMYLTIGDPLAAGNSYVWISRIWDKNSKKSIEATVTIEVVE